MGEEERRGAASRAIFSLPGIGEGRGSCFLGAHALAEGFSIAAVRAADQVFRVLFLALSKSACYLVVRGRQECSGGGKNAPIGPRRAELLLALQAESTEHSDGGHDATFALIRVPWADWGCCTLCARARAVGR